jgi:hypothetical protein
MLENGDSTPVGAAFAYRCSGPVVTAYPNGHRWFALKSKTALS